MNQPLITTDPKAPFTAHKLNYFVNRAPGQQWRTFLNRAEMIHSAFTQLFTMTWYPRAFARWSSVQFSWVQFVWWEQASDRCHTPAILSRDFVARVRDFVAKSRRTQHSSPFRNGVARDVVSHWRFSWSIQLALENCAGVTSVLIPLYICFPDDHYWAGYVMITFSFFFFFSSSSSLDSSSLDSSSLDFIVTQ